LATIREHQGRLETDGGEPASWKEIVGAFKP
jgi:hypothetical protein